MTPPATYVELISGARQHLNRALDAANGTLTLPDTQGALLRWAACITTFANHVTRTAPGERFGGLFRDDRPLPSTAHQWRHALTSAALATGTADLPAPTHPCHVLIDQARTAIGAAGDIAITHRFRPIDIARTLPAWTALTFQLATPRALVQAGVDHGIATTDLLRPLLILRDATGPAMSLARQYGDDGPAPDLRLRTTVTPQDGTPQEWLAHCNVLADRLDELASGPARLPITVAAIVAGAQARTHLGVGDTAAAGKWIRVSEQLRPRRSTLAVDPDIDQHWQRMQQLFQTLRARHDADTTAVFLPIHEAARAALDRAAHRVWELGETGRIDQWVAGRHRRPYLPSLPSPVFMPQRSAEPLPPLPPTHTAPALFR